MDSGSKTPTLKHSDTPFSKTLFRHSALGWSIGSLVARAWLTLWLWDRSPYGRYLRHGQLGGIGLDRGIASVILPITLYILGWTLMTVAMMLPTMVPLLEIFRRLAARRPDRSQLLVLVIAGYQVSGPVSALWRMRRLAAA